MKYKWNEPQLIQLGVENTYEDISNPIVIPNDPGKHMHFCHAMNDIHEPSDCNNNTHPTINKCNDKVHNSSEYSACCCVGLSLTS